jgi:hypothetical protein
LLQWICRSQLLVDLGGVGGDEEEECELGDWEKWDVNQISIIYVNFGFASGRIVNHRARRRHQWPVARQIRRRRWSCRDRSSSEDHQDPRIHLEEDRNL